MNSSPKKSLSRSFLHSILFHPALSHPGAQISLVLLFGVIGFLLLTFLSESPPREEPPVVRTPVGTLQLPLESYPSRIRGFGIVRAERSLELRPEVSGVVTEVNPDFQAGGRIKMGELLFQIDKRDYEAEVNAQRALLERARFELKLEEGNQIVAAREWDLLKKNDGKLESTLSRELALRKPHLLEKQAALSAAESRLAKSVLDLERTTVLAPFDSIVLEEHIETGKYISPQEVVANLVGTESFEVEVQVLQSDLKWLKSLFCSNRTTCNPSELEASVIQRLEDSSFVTHSGTAIRVLGDVDDTGRMAKVLVRIPRPLENTNGSPVLIGSYVEVVIEGDLIEDVYRLPRTALRTDSKIWTINDDDQLSSISVQVIFQDSTSLYVRGALTSDTKIITSPLPGALENMPLREIENEAK